MTKSDLVLFHFEVPGNTWFHWRDEMVKMHRENKNFPLLILKYEDCVTV